MLSRDELRKLIAEKLDAAKELYDSDSLTLAAERNHEAEVLIKKIPFHSYDETDWRNLARYENLVGVMVLNQKDEELRWFEKAIQSLLKVKKENFTAQDWRSLAKYQRNCCTVSSDPNQKIIVIEQAIASLIQVPKQYFEALDWHGLVSDQHNLAVYLTEICLFKKAVLTWHDLLDSHLLGFNSIIEKNKYKLISNAYTSLNYLTPSNACEKQLYALAQDIFKKNVNENVKQQFQQLYLSAENSPHSLLARALLQLMRLILLAVQREDFPNLSVKSWLAAKAEHNFFESCLKKIGENYQPITLLETADQSASLSLAMVHELAMLKSMLHEQQQEINQLKIKNANLQVTIQSLENKTIYDNKATFFNTGETVSIKVEEYRKEKILIKHQ